MMADLGGFDETALTMAQFDDYIPAEASTTEFGATDTGFSAVCRMMEEGAEAASIWPLESE